MKIAVRLACLLISLFVVTPGNARGASTNNIEIIVNNTFMNTDIHSYILQGTTIVPLNVVQNIPGIAVQWDNMTKTVTIDRDGETIKLVAGQKTATIGTQQILLPVASTILKGRVMVPLRFIAESADAYVVWNAGTRRIYVAKASEELMAQATSAKLGEARTAALKIPRVSSLKTLEITNDTQNQNYYFPEGISNQFFIQGGPGISYFEVVGQHVEEIWTAKLNFDIKSSDSLFFLPYKIMDQDGEKPSIKGRMAYYHLMLPIMEATYGFIDSTGKFTTDGQQSMTLNEIFEIPGEK
ncbi:copper amine oxidase N-terminal domain-containing protein [Paenibacillus wynnii]|uniref:copper amine oxidase N-terminal domain-containing protein n=1 Tax=Paenibacillus wynnii TaxID=268407 RepID=UPI00278DAD56|nr:copper amine oxidase N-terminal domain-containing protein [Paenibacillus wynnii]MDQ0194474.1 hypothetical protein [Paenibacillus wynnii]